MTDSTMPKRETGVYSIKASKNYQWRIKTPDDLKAQYPSEWAHRCSLGTPDLLKANAMASVLRAEWLNRFETQRKKLNPTYISAFTPDLVQRLHDQELHRIVRGDEARRFDVAHSGPVIRDLVTHGVLPADTPDPTLTGPLGGVPQDYLDWDKRTRQAGAEERARRLSRGDLNLVFMGAQWTAESLGFTFDEKTEGVRPALLEFAKAHRQAQALMAQRDQGEIVDTPPPPDTTTKLRAQAESWTRSQAMTLRYVFEKWEVADVRGKDATNACGRALKLFEESMGGTVPPVTEITRAHGADFKGWLVAKIAAGEMSSKTAHDRLTSVKGLLRFACDELEAIPKHPWRSLDIKHKTENPRRPWTHTHLQTMVGLPLFAAYELPSAVKTAWKGGGAAAYWVPLLGLFTGATVSELCQLRTNDVEIAADGSGLIHVTEDDEGQQLKNFEHRRRVVPIHSQLVRLGFLTYFAKLSPGSLWPDMKFRKGKPGAYFSDWFGKYRKPTPEAEPLFPAMPIAALPPSAPPSAIAATASSPRPPVPNPPFGRVAREFAAIVPGER